MKEITLTANEENKEISRGGKNVSTGTAPEYRYVCSNAISRMEKGEVCEQDDNFGDTVSLHEMASADNQIYLFRTLYIHNLCILQMLIPF